MSFAYPRKSPDAYERLLQAIVKGDQTLFVRSDEVELAWKWTDCLRVAMQNVKVHTYDKYSWGPASTALLGTYPFV